MDASSQLLGGAQRVRTRVRGFAPWALRGATAELLDQVRGVLEEYEDYLPLTIRQIFYRLVGAHEYEKTERAYARLCEHLNRARRARLIPMDVIRDDGGVISEPDSWESAEHFLCTVRAMAKNFKLDRSSRDLRGRWYGAAAGTGDASTRRDRDVWRRLRQHD